MAKDKEDKIEKPEKAEKPRDPRQEKWDAIWAEYKIKNPAKYALKRATSYTEIVNGVEVSRPKRDEYLEIPDDFK